MDQVFSLIKSMSQSEKRYFSRFSKFQTPDSTNSYLALFNQMVKLDEYNEKNLKKEFGATHFAQLKQQLFKKLLQSLRLYYTSNEVQNEIFIHLHNYKLLASKGIQVAAEKELKRAERISFESEMSYESAIIFRERNLLINGMFDVFELQARIEENELFVKKQIENISNEHEYEKLFLEIEVINKQLESARNVEELDRVTKFLSNPLLVNDDLALSIQSKIFFHFSKGLAYYLKSDYDNCITHMKLSSDFLEKNRHILNRLEDLYVRSLANSCLSFIHLTKYNEFEKNLEKLIAVKLNDLSTIDYRNYIVYVLQLMYFNKNENFAKAVDLIISCDDFSNQMEKKMSMKTGVSQEKVYGVFQKATAYLGNGMHKKASLILNEFINQKAKGLKEDAYIVARLFFLCIRFEMNDEALIESELRSIHRYLKEKNKLFQFEKHLLQFISKMLISTSTQEKKNNFLELKNGLDSVKEIEFERNAFIYFDFSGWVNKFFK